MKRIDISNDLINSLKEGKPVQTLADFKTKFGCTDITLKRNIQRCNLLVSYNKNSKYYTLPELAAFNHHGIWAYQGIMFSRYGDMYQTLIGLINKSPKGYTSSELAAIVQVKTADALRILFQQKRLQRQKDGRAYVYYSIDTEHFKRQAANRLSVSQPALPSEKNVIISVLVEIIHQNTICVPSLQRGLEKRLSFQVSAQQIEGIISEYGLKKKNFKSLV